MGIDDTYKWQTVHAGKSLSGVIEERKGTGLMDGCRREGYCGWDGGLGGIIWAVIYPQ
jgi:hypothetical protein